MISFRHHNHGAEKRVATTTRRVRRDRRPSVIGVGDRLACRYRDVSIDRGASVWESHRAAATRPLNSISKYTRPITGWGCTMTLAGRLMGKVKCEAGIISILSPIPGRGLEAETGSKGRPQAVYNAHRIAQANKSGADAAARLRTRGSAPSACKPWDRLAECRARISEILYRLGVFAKTLSTGKQGTARAVNQRPVGSPRSATVRLPRAGVKIGSTIFTAWRVPGQS